MIGEFRRRFKKLLSQELEGSTVDGHAARMVEQSEHIASVIESDNGQRIQLLDSADDEKVEPQEEAATEKELGRIKSRNTIEKLGFRILANHLPRLPDYRRLYEQSGIPIIYEAYLSTSILVSLILMIPAFLLSFIIEYRSLHTVFMGLLLASSGILSGVVFGVSLVVCIVYPLLLASSNKSKLENHLAYSFGILGVLSAAGINLERLFERIAASESNPVLAGLAMRFLRNVRIFGLDTQKALKEVADHSPSQLFSRMLESIIVSYRTTGTIQDLVMFESSRLLQEKKDRLRKTVGSLSVLAELYITLVVVGPIIFIVMMAIFGLLPEGGLPNPVSIINLIVFLAIPLFSVIFLLLLDSAVAKA